MLNNLTKSILLITTLSLAAYSCKSPEHYQLSNAKGYLIQVDTIPADDHISAFLAPYRDSLQEVMSKKISYSPEFLQRNDPRLGTWLCELSMEETKRYLADRGIKTDIDAVLYNAGGMRTTLPKGDITNSFVYEFMPFDNACVLVKLKGEQITQMLDYLTKSANYGMLHPTYGIKLVVRDNKWTSNTKINGKKIDPNKIYTILTSDFLREGGDHMDFFKEPVEVLETNIKIREQIADYFSHTDTITIPQYLAYELK